MTRPSPARAWWQASRPPTLWAAVSPVAVGTGCAYSIGCFSAGPALAALLGAVFLQLGANYSNDLFDFRHGADGRDRLGPRRAVSAGWISEPQMIGGTAVAFLLASLCGAYLVVEAGWVVVAIGVASILAALAYTGGPAPLAYVGLGDLFVFVFFGLVAVTGSSYVQCLRVPMSAWLAATAVGSLGVAILAVNNLRDRVGDRAARKRTLVVRYGEDFGRAQILAALAMAYATALLLAIAYGEIGALIALVSLPLALRTGVRALRLDGAALNPLLGEVARLQLVFSLLLAVGIAWL